VSTPGARKRRRRRAKGLTLPLATVEVHVVQAHERRLLEELPAEKHDEEHGDDDVLKIEEECLISITSPEAIAE
jgi:hypothetical protein